MKKIRSISDFLSIIHELDMMYAEMHFEDYGCISPLLVFRGHSKDTYELLPGIFRGYAFSYEEVILDEFIMDACRFIDAAPEEILKYAEYAQHFGVPTRLLDWSANPLTALFFACRSHPHSDATVWILNYLSYGDFSNARNGQEEKTYAPSDQLYRSLINPMNLCWELAGRPIDAPDLPLVYAPKYKDLRMSMQSSYFMLWGLKEQPLNQLIPPERCVPVPDNLDELRDEKILLLNCLVKQEDKQNILYELDMMGVNEKNIFPGLDGIGQYLSRKHRDFD